MVEQEERYDVLRNDRGELLISLKAREGEPETPIILYDGGEHALLQRKKGADTIILDYVNPGVRETLATVKTLLIVEFDGDEAIREYDVDVHQVKQLPISEEAKPEPIE